MLLHITLRPRSLVVRGIWGRVHYLCRPDHYCQCNRQWEPNFIFMASFIEKKNIRTLFSSLIKILCFSHAWTRSRTWLDLFSSLGRAFMGVTRRFTPTLKLSRCGLPLDTISVWSNSGKFHNDSAFPMYLIFSHFDLIPSKLTFHSFSFVEIFLFFF